MPHHDYEISFLLDGLRQFRFHGSEEHAKAISEAMHADSDAGPGHVGDIQVYPVGGVSAGGAEDLLDNITSAIGLDDFDDEDKEGIDRVRDLARKVDKACDEGSNGRDYLVEFIWNNGGGDDNPYAEGFRGDADNYQASLDFADALGQWLDDHGHAYDFTWGIESEQHPQMDVEDAIEATIDAFKEGGIAPTQLSTLMAARDLEASTPAVRAPKPRRNL